MEPNIPMDFEGMEDVDSLIHDLMTGMDTNCVMPHFQPNYEFPEQDSTAAPNPKRRRPPEFDGNAPYLEPNLSSNAKMRSPFEPIPTSQALFQPEMNIPSPQPSNLPTGESSQPLLQQISRDLEGLQEQLKHIRNAQVNLPVPVQHSDFEQLDLDQKQMISTCHIFKNHLENIVSMNILSPLSYLFF
eukprot:CAMPEP_0117033546 /NCGR_PEP_ID=MMETSP0472-20121206/23956_1 /TAXON_ID=693140 ORGANISM="Tiarina fusus, Strain LIS" /NCGR_SAMPLE_ID=MMETSP0472 /ASSEMBLY_ACC=CAM_ASM_000603 /LENGTH=186 /DNA_ID=CAMNT_0004742483 /DNA_START=18 /DNA_END=578 /DNA_ORIENTATION=+